MRHVASLACAVAFAALAGCGGHVVGHDASVDVPVLGDTPADGVPPVDAGPTPRTGDVDLLLEVDNSNSMRDNQTNLLNQLRPVLGALTSPPCTSPSNPAPHTCNHSDPTDQPVHPAVQSLHVGVISQDLGTAGSSVPGCGNSDHGDNGLLNPIRNGDSLRTHEPWVTAPPTFGRPADCTDPNEYPAFIAYDSATTNLETFAHDFACNAALYVNGCGLEQQLEAIHRAIIVNDASDHPGNTGPNAGFLRDGALLVIMLLSDEEDGSVRDCRYAMGASCSDALDVFNPASSAWSSMNLNLRDYLYQPGSSQDPTWPLERYVDPAHPTAGWMALKPGHPERVVFVAITGVPLPSDGANSNWVMSNNAIDWDQLLGTPAADPNDFVHRNAMNAINTLSTEGPVSMRQANADTYCTERVVPACRRRGTSYDPSFCTTDQQYFAWPARRVVEVARRFDQANLCNGAPCRNGIVASICDTDYSLAFQAFVDRL